jgi:tetratricopeptide (TPR) repeat protein
MKYLFLILLLYPALPVYSQSVPDSFLVKYQKAKTGEEKGRMIDGYVRSFSSNNNIMTGQAIKLQLHLKMQDDDAGADYAGLHVARLMASTGDYVKSLNESLQILANFEKRKDAYGIIRSSHITGGILVVSKDYDRAISYYKKAIPIAISEKDNDLLGTLYNNIGAAYATWKKPDSGLVYAQMAVQLDKEFNGEYRLVYSLSTVGENYMAAGDYDIAIPFLKKAKLIGQKFNLAYPYAFVLNDLTESFMAVGQYDSAKRFGYEAVTVTQSNGLKDMMVTAYENLNRIYEKTGQEDSMNKYFRLAMLTKDSMFTMEKSRMVQALAFKDQQRQQEEEMEAQQEEEDRRTSMQYIAIALGIILFISISFLLSRSIVINAKWVSFFGILGLLAVFEFINLLIHPYLTAWTHHSPLAMLGALMIIAALLIPFHHKLEKILTRKLVEKNNRVRLTAARKIVANLEGKEKEALESSLEEIKN